MPSPTSIDRAAGPRTVANGQVRWGHRSTLSWNRPRRRTGGAPEAVREATGLSFFRGTVCISRREGSHAITIGRYSEIIPRPSMGSGKNDAVVRVPHSTYAC